MDRAGWRLARGTWKRLAAALLLILAAATRVEGGEVRATHPIDRWSSHIAEASNRFAIPSEWIRRVMRAESGGRIMLHGRPITSPAGAMGLMQLMPGTWSEMRALHGLGADPHDPRDNILAGAAYLRAMHDRFGYPGLFAAYNAGPARYARHLATGRPLPSETVAYVAAVGRPSRDRSPARPAEARGGRLFASLVPHAPSPVQAALSPPANALFVQLRTVPADAE